jgi:hypothetical protein
MSIRFYIDKEGNEKHNVYGVEVPQLRCGDLFIIDTNIIFPAILPRERRSVGNIQKIMKKLPSEKRRVRREKRKKIRNQSPKKLMAEYTRKVSIRRIEVVNAIEDGIFYNKGFIIGITNIVYDELLNLERRCREDNARRWLRKVKGKYVYSIYLPIRKLRNKYPDISKKLEHPGDFSVVMAAYLLGCNHASDDYRSVAGLSKSDELDEMSYVRWGNKWGGGHRNEFKQWDSEGLIMFLGKKIDQDYE